MPPPVDFTAEKYKRLIALAQARGEPVEPLIKRLVIETIEHVQAGLEREPATPALTGGVPPGTSAVDR